MSVISYESVENKILTIRNMSVIIDSDVADLYQVETRRVNEAVSRNKDKFPEGYLLQLDVAEKTELVAICDRFKALKHSTSLPKAFTEKGLYMLATILKSPMATKTTLMIIDTFAKARELGHITRQVQALPERSPKSKPLMERAGELVSDFFMPEDGVNVDTETVLEMNFAVFKMRRTVKKSNKRDAQ